MSQGQPTRPQEGGGQQQQPIKYGDVFQVSGDLAKQPIAPQDAAMMQAAESTVFGQTQKGGPAAAMQAAATINERSGLVGHRDITDAAKLGGITVAEADIPGARIITESVAGQVLARFFQARPVPSADSIQTLITIGEALEAVAQSAGDKPVDHCDAAAIMAAECRATGSNHITPGGVASAAQSAAAYNAGLIGDEGKVKLADVLLAAAAKLPADKAATREDAEGVMSAELRNNPELKMYPGGVAEAVAAAARVNEKGST